MIVQLTKALLSKPAGERIDVSKDGAKSLITQQVAVQLTDDVIIPALKKAMKPAFTKAGVNRSLTPFPPANAPTQGSPRARRSGLPFDLSCQRPAWQRRACQPPKPVEFRCELPGCLSAREVSD